MPVTRLVAPGPEVAMQTPTLPGGAGVPVGHVRGALLVADEDVVDGELAQSVVGGEDGSARVAEDFVHAFAGEGGPDDFGSGELGMLIFGCHLVLLCYTALLRLQIYSAVWSVWTTPPDYGFCSSTKLVGAKNRFNMPEKKLSVGTI